MKIIEKIKGQLRVNKEKLPKFILLVAIALLVAFGSTLVNFTSPIIFIALSILFLVTWYKAGVAVFRSLLEVSVGLTLILYLAEQYCKIPDASRTADTSLQAILGFGLIYILVVFLKSLWKELMGDKEKQIKGSLETFKEINEGSILS